MGTGEEVQKYVAVERGRENQRRDLNVLQIKKEIGVK